MPAKLTKSLGVSCSRKLWMNLESGWPDATAVHTAFGSVGTVVAERRVLYRFAAEMCGSGQAELSEQQLDNPLFRFRIGEALAGRTAFDPEEQDELAGIVTELNVDGARLGVTSGVDANVRLAAVLSVVHAQGGAPGEPPRLLTEAAGPPFQEALGLVEAGLRTLCTVSPRLAADLLPHTALLAVLDPGTSGGLVSASSRLVPGLILIDQPSCAYDVAEALVHEGAHQKFFDLAITHDFLGADLARDRIFRPPWSGAAWPVEQAIAAFHAYALLGQFAEDVTRAQDDDSLGPHTLLPSARARQSEIGRWLLGVEDALGPDASWLLRTLLGEEVADEAPSSAAVPMPDGLYQLNPVVKTVRTETTGRLLLAKPGKPPLLHWLDGSAVELVDQLAGRPLAMSELRPEEVGILSSLVESALVHRVVSPG